jgi:DNA-directed RNA polymerase specialized sigma24 family protein
VGQSERDPRDGDESEGSTSPFVDGNPSPEFVATVLDELSVRLEQLDDPVLRQIALLDLEGYSPREIQERLGLGSERTVFRKKKLLRSIWQQTIEDLRELT